MNELNEILLQEHLFWQQKDGLRSIQGGEQNTRYFHQFVLIRCSRQRIIQLKDARGEWQSDPDVLKHIATEFFTALYIGIPSTMVSSDHWSFPPLTHSDKRWLNRGALDNYTKV